MLFARETWTALDVTRMAFFSALHSTRNKQPTDRFAPSGPFVPVLIVLAPDIVNSLWSRSDSKVKIRNDFCL